MHANEPTCLVMPTYNAVCTDLLKITWIYTCQVMSRILLYNLSYSRVTQYKNLHLGLVSFSNTNSNYILAK